MFIQRYPTRRRKAHQRGLVNAKNSGNSRLRDFETNKHCSVGVRMSHDQVPTILVVFGNKTDRIYPRRERPVGISACKAHTQLAFAVPIIAIEPMLTNLVDIIEE